MVKLKYTLILLLVTACLAACEEEKFDTSTMFTGPSTIGDAELLDSLARFENDYGIMVAYNFKASDYSPVGTGRVLAYTPVTSKSSVLDVMHYIEENVFSFFPAGFVKQYMPSAVLLVDSLKVTYSHEDEINNEIWEKDYTITGNITSKYLVLGNVGTRFDPEAENLQEELLSLFIEYLCANNKLPPIPAEFQKASEKAATSVGAVIYSATSSLPNTNYPYWDGGSGFTSWGGIGGDVPDATPWLGRGILKIGRIGRTGYERRVILGMDIAMYEFHKGTVEQDFADFAAFILSKTPTERETFYAEIEADTSVYTYDGVGDPRFPYAGPAGAEAMRVKDGMVKSYIRDNFGIAVE
ncbi:MAG: hypothetical protein LBJ57_01010 [Prevotellaceae bacterium]|jgi:hypothetical protein|nr:hypothetical protein [Prevotellaceae bacterium]